MEIAVFLPFPALNIKWVSNEIDGECESALFGKKKDKDMW